MFLRQFGQAGLVDLTESEGGI